MELYSHFQAVRTASVQLAEVAQSRIDDMLRRLADTLEEEKEYLLYENQKDLDRMDPANPKFDRLKLTGARIANIASDMRNVAELSSPVGEIMNEWTRPNGIHIQKVRVPFGVIGIIYEARPNVTPDVFSLCIKSGNACILKGGKDAEFSNIAIVSLIHRVLEEFQISKDCVFLMPNDHESTGVMLQAVGLVDLIIPRGSRSLIDFVRSNAKVPVIETGAGICHTYFDEYASLEMGKDIVENGKTRRVSVCNALDCLIVHQNRLSDLPALCEPLVKSHVMLYADGQAYQVLQGHYPEEWLQQAQDEHFGTEFLDYKMAIKTVPDIQEALNHIRKYSSGHSEAIISDCIENQELFRRFVDASCVYVNLPTSFTDGAQFGFGAEIGISTQKMHARGPMALPEITTYKYILSGNGQIRKP